MREALQEDHVDTKLIGIDELHGTGTALITLDAEGQNDIMVYGGANQAMTTEVLKNADAVFEEIDFLISQFETPQAVTAEAFKQAKEHGVTTILNPAPAHEILPELLQYTDVVIPNDSESFVLTGIKITDEDSMLKSAEWFKQQGAKNLLITLGSKGSSTARHTVTEWCQHSRSRPLIRRQPVIRSSVRWPPSWTTT